MMTLNDGRSELWQWDTGRTLAVDADCSQVHFSNKVFGRSIDVDVTDGVAIIPDILLQTDKDLNVWAFVGASENGYTKISKTFKVNRRNKPADYVFTPQEQILLKDATAILEEAKVVANDAIESAKQAEDSSTQAAKSADAAADSASAAEAAKQAAAQSASAADNRATDAENAAEEAERSAGIATDAVGSSALNAENAHKSALAAQQSANNAAESQSAAAASAASAERNAGQAATDAKTASDAKVAAAGSAEAAAGSAVSAGNSASAAARSERAAGASEVKAAESEKAAKASEQAAAKSAQAALESKTAAATSEVNAAASAKKAKDIADSLPEDYVSAVNDIAELKTNKADKTELETVKNQVENITPDDSTVGEKPWSSKHIVDSLCQPFEESGNPVQVYPVENYPLGVKVNWEPVQEGSGDPSPDNIRPIVGLDSVKVNRAGKNLLDFSSFANYTNWRVDIATEGNAPTNYINKGYILPVKPSKTYAISFEFLGDTFPTYLYIVKSINGVSKRYLYITTGKIENKVVSFTPEDNEIWYLRMGRSEPESSFNKQIEKITNIQLELGSTATPYEPYTGSTTEIALPETVYGGEVDAVSGEVAETWGLVTFDGTEEWKVSGKLLDNKTDWYYVSPKIPNAVNAATQKGNEICSHYPHADVANNNTVQGCAIVWGAIRIRWGDTIPDDADAWKAYLAAQYAAGTPVQIAYKLATSTPFTATGTQPIPALSGVNTIYTDADGVVVTGAEDPKHTITELKNAIISLGGNI